MKSLKIVVDRNVGNRKGVPKTKSAGEENISIGLTVANSFSRVKLWQLAANLVLRLNSGKGCTKKASSLKVLPWKYRKVEGT